MICYTEDHSPSAGLFVQHVTVTYNTAGNTREKACQLAIKHYCGITYKGKFPVHLAFANAQKIVCNQLFDGLI